MYEILHDKKHANCVLRKLGSLDFLPSALFDIVTSYFYLCCGTCRMCLGNFEPLCENLGGYVGRECDGGYAEYIKLPERNFIKLPDGLEDQLQLADQYPCLHNS